MVGLGRFFFRYRNFVGPLIFLVALGLSRPRYPFGDPDLKIVFEIAAWILVLLGEAVRVLAVGYEYIVRGGRNRQVYADNLVQGGVFGHCRNPLYAANLLIAFGLALIVNACAFYLIVIPGVIVTYSAIVAAEEAYLNGKFGAEYADYCRRVSRWWPRFGGFAQSIEGMRFEWRRVLVKEYNTMFVLPVTLIGLHFWTMYWLEGASAMPSNTAVATAIAFWAALYLSVRALKKSRLISG